MTVFLLKSLYVLWVAVGVVVLANILTERSQREAAESSPPDQTKMNFKEWPQQAGAKIFRFLTMDHAAALLFLTSFVFATRYFFQPGRPSLAGLLDEFYANLSAEFLSIAITVFVIDRLNQRRQNERLKARLTRDLGSGSNESALIAISELRVHGWLDEALSKANLFKAKLFGVDLRRANLSGVNLSHANLSNAHLFGANLSNAKLFGADLSHANLSGANLSHANLSNADLSNAHLTLADLSGAMLILADLSKADLNNANLSHANLSHANLSEAEMFRADLSHANLSHAHLSHADLSHANLSEAEMFRADLSHAKYSTKPYKDDELGVMLRPTLWPEDFDLAGAGAINIDEGSED